MVTTRRKTHKRKVLTIKKTYLFNIIFQTQTKKKKEKKNTYQRGADDGSQASTTTTSKGRWTTSGSKS